MHFCPMFSCRIRPAKSPEDVLCLLPQRKHIRPPLYDRRRTHDGSQSLGARSAGSSVLIKIRAKIYYVITFQKHIHPVRQKKNH